MLKRTPNRMLAIGALTLDVLPDVRIAVGGGFRGMVQRIRDAPGAAYAAVNALPKRGPRGVKALGLALKHAAQGAPDERAIMVHTRACKRRDETCECAGVRLVCGATA